ncbi:S49 family peptidase [Brevundimonas subvibrioides]|uniref:Peptidase S49 n=1 Tax=Brevundimonas subvibrioides (strain ATCC 15264 / DSM 4735 / LMG 14903 / NBRC 16000 / CB 81) TaxID=633149 RepID=D9QFX8_BRESC|nr:S49 family peptidase [Brevundimonas subvibrioides]ADL00692.1 peptidase S49 [Brevundimonas subvibrioides ATCC 15264]
MQDVQLLASRYAGRPLLLTPTAARDLANRVRQIDSRAFERPSRVGAFLRRVGLADGGKRPRISAMDDDGIPAVPMDEQLAYSPRWLGDVEDTGFCWSLKDGVALICCDTPLVERGDEFCGMVWHGYDTLLIAMREAMADARVRGIFLRLDTPGGVVGGGLPALAQFMREARESAGGKPIWVYADMACSAGYWIAAQADRILAPSVGYVGSIGAVMVHEDWSGALEQDGVAITSIEFPDGGVKTEGAWWKALSEGGRTALQSDINQVGEMFLADVAAGRPGLDREAMLAMRADAFMAEHTDPARSGVTLGLADEIATEEAAFAALVDHVSAPADPALAAAPGARTASTPKERPMATKTHAGGKPTRAAQVAQAKKAMKLAQANLARVQASDAADPAEDEDDNAPESGTDEAALPGEDEPGDETDPDADDEDDDEAKAIAASAEAASHPALALAAIRSGMSLSQFKASAGAAGPAHRPSRLDAAMTGARRLTPDAPVAGSQGMGGALVADAQRRRDASKRGR